MQLDMRSCSQRLARSPVSLRAAPASFSRSIQPPAPGTLPITRTDVPSAKTNPATARPSQRRRSAEGTPLSPAAGDYVLALLSQSGESVPSLLASSPTDLQSPALTEPTSRAIEQIYRTLSRIRLLHIAQLCRRLPWLHQRDLQLLETQVSQLILFLALSARCI